MMCYWLISQLSSRHLSSKILEKLDFGRKVTKGWEQARSAAWMPRDGSSSELPCLFRGRLQSFRNQQLPRGKMCNDQLDCAMLQLTKNIIFCSSRNPAGECRIKNCYLKKNKSKRIRVNNGDNGIILSRFHPLWNLEEIFHKHIMHCLKLAPKFTPAGSVYRTFLPLLPKDKGQVRPLTQKSGQLIC